MSPSSSSLLSTSPGTMMDSSVNLEKSISTAIATNTPRRSIASAIKVADNGDGTIVEMA
jgi:hypothetical protein